MLSLLPVALLLLSAVVIQIVGRITMRAGSTWLLAAVIGFITWLSMILIGILLPPAVSISNWLPEPYAFTAISFQATRETWIFGFLLVSLLQAVIFFNARNLDSSNYLQKITGAMVLTAFGLLAVFSRTPLAFVLTWSLMDLAEFGVLTATLGSGKEDRSTLTAVLSRELGIILLVLFMAIAPEQVVQSDRLSILTAWLLLIIALLRMGIFPLRQTLTNDPRIRRGFLTLLRALPLITVFAFLLTIVNFGLPERSLQLLLVVFSIATIYGSTSWFFAKDELVGRPYWFFTLGCIGMITFLTSAPGALIALAVVTVAGGTGIFLYSPRFRKLYAFIPVLLVGLLALPLTPTTTINHFFATEVFSIHQVFLIPAYALLLAGVIKHASRKDEDTDISEAWMRLFHRISLYFIALVPWIMMGVMFKLHTLQANWWVSTTILIITAGFTALHFLFFRRSLPERSIFSRIKPVIVKIFQTIDKILKLNWLSRIFSSIGFFTGKIAALLNRVQEGDGGILWSFLFLVLLLSLLLTPQVP